MPTNYNRSMQPASSPALVSITSRSSQWFKRFRKAIDEHEHEVVLEGPKQIRDSIALGWRPLESPGTVIKPDLSLQLLPDWDSRNRFSTPSAPPGTLRACWDCSSGATTNSRTCSPTNLELL